LLDISEVSDFSDYFVICSGTSERMIEALANDITKHLRNNNKIRGTVEGLPQDGWILVDYGPVLMHIFSPERRIFYNLEELWSDGQVLLHLQ
jgi:ribosome-associated protein